MASSQSINPQKLTEAGLARELGGVSRQAVHELVKRGILSKDASGLIDVEMAKIALLNRVRPSGKTLTNLAEPAQAAVVSLPSVSQDDTSPEITSYHVANYLVVVVVIQIEIVISG